MIKPVEVMEVVAQVLELSSAERIRDRVRGNPTRLVAVRLVCRLLYQAGYTQDVIAATLRRDRSTVAYHLDAEVDQDLLAQCEARLSMPGLASQAPEHDPLWIAINDEVAYANAKWAGGKDLGTFLLVLQAELDEAIQDHIKGRHDAARCELLQVAAVAVHALRQHGYVRRGGV